MSRIRKQIKRWIRRQGFEFRRIADGELDDVTRLARIANDRKLGVFLDVGANRGQFAIDLRIAGYTGRIISFEPTRAAHEALSLLARTDPGWTAAARMALGAKRSRASINVSANSYSSSLFPMMDTHVNAAPSSAYVTSEEIQVEMLDEVLPQMGMAPNQDLALKIDTQGYEAEVLAGATTTLARIQLIFTELSLVPLYAGAPTFEQMYSRLVDAGFRCVGLSHEFSDRVSGEMLQVNGTFVRA